MIFSKSFYIPFILSVFLTVFSFQLNTDNNSRTIAQTTVEDAQAEEINSANLEINEIQRIRILAETVDELFEIIEDEYNIEIDRSDPMVKEKVRSIARNYKNFLKIVGSFSKKAPDVFAVREAYWLFKWIVIAPTLGATLGKVGMAWTIPLMWNTILSTKIVAYFYWILREKVRSLYGIKVYKYTFHKLESTINKVWDEVDSKGMAVIDYPTPYGDLSFKVQTSIMAKIRSALGGKTVTISILEKIINDSTYISFAKKYAGDTNIYAQILVSKILTNFEQTEELFKLIPEHTKTIPGTYQTTLLNIRDTTSKAYFYMKNSDFHYKKISNHRIFHIRDRQYRETKKIKKAINAEIYKEIKNLQKTRYNLAKAILDNDPIDEEKIGQINNTAIQRIEQLKDAKLSYEQMLGEIPNHDTIEGYQNKVNRAIDYWLETKAPNFLRTSFTIDCQDLIKLFQ